jgi:hypothetical protein
VADPGPARPSHGYIARFSKLEQALEGWPPANIESAPDERDQRSGAGRPTRHVRLRVRRRRDARGKAFGPRPSLRRKHHAVAQHALLEEVKLAGSGAAVGEVALRHELEPAGDRRDKLHPAP